MTFGEECDRIFRLLNLCESCDIARMFELHTFIVVNRASNFFGGNLFHLRRFILKEFSDVAPHLSHCPTFDIMGPINGAFHLFYSELHNTPFEYKAVKLSFSRICEGNADKFLRSIHKFLIESDIGFINHLIDTPTRLSFGDILCYDLCGGSGRGGPCWGKHSLADPENHPYLR